MPPAARSASVLQQVKLLYASLFGFALAAVVPCAVLLMQMPGAFSKFWLPALPLAVALGSLCYLNVSAHRVVENQARLTDVLINSLGQGFLTFDAHGLCGPVYSQACHVLLTEGPITGEPVEDILGLTADQRKEFADWRTLLFAPDPVDFEDTVRFLPQRFETVDGRAIGLDYRAVRAHGKLTSIVMIATDRTTEQEAEELAMQERQFASMICAIFSERQGFVLAMQHAGGILSRLSRFNDPFAADFFREVHTIKGAALHFKMEKLGNALHELEGQLREAKSMPPE
ncbi:MAG TPA: hypothetical protein VHB73_06230, partial [Alphaproteobacteria bacterium]|nr:hypothetical protein [Alphaproteobacteria bacterium]